jgi:NADP-dependent 3-hydroxy acid dehydrogenase YdfG
VRFAGDAERAKAVYRGMRPLTADEVAEVIGYVVDLPEHVNVLDVVLMPVAQRSTQVVHREA